MFQTFKALLPRASKGVLVVYLALSAIRFVGTAPTWVTQYLAMDRLASGDFSGAAGLNIASLCASLVSLAILIVVGTLTVGLGRAMRRQMVEGEGAIDGFAGAFTEARARFWQTMGAYLLYGVAVAVGALFCVLPGLFAAFAFAFVPYLVAAVDAEIMDSFKRSWELVKKNVGPMLVVIGIVVAIGIVLALINFGIAAALTAALGPIGIIVSSALVTLVGIAVGYFLFLLLGALLITCETADANVPLRL